ncbi:hypothetical protein FACS1894159_10120 [Bacteroidia bacterium]|nr:hypothetical protein FACS1894159_10120 [Bacteroidia bacterium]
MRNLVMALCALIAFAFVLSVLLGVFTRHNTHRTVPDFRGMQIDKATKAARRASMRTCVADSLFLPAYEPGVVLEQVPAPGAKVKAGRRIFLTVNSTHRQKVRIPYVAGFSLRQAKNNLEVAGLEIEKLVYRGDIATNNVLEERYGKTVITPKTDMEVEVGQGVTLVVGLGPGATAQAVPRVVGFSLKEAKSRIWEVGFNVGAVEMDEGITLLNQSQAKVYRQTPDYPQRAGYGAQVNIRLTLDQTRIDRGIDRSDAVARKVVQDEEQQDETDSKDDTPPGKP